MFKFGISNSMLVRWNLLHTDVFWPSDRRWHRWPVSLAAIAPLSEAQAHALAGDASLFGATFV